MEKFGYDQAEAYQAKLISAFDDIADGNFPRRNGKAIWSALVRDNLLVARVGSHFVLFLETELEVVIVDILHQVMDIPGRLGT